MADLVKLGWGIRVSNSKVEIRRPAAASGVQEEIRESARRQHQSQRDDQLRQTPVREFIRQMETRKPFGNQFVSIFSLMRDGAELAGQLRKAGSYANSDRRGAEIGHLVKPYLQFVRGEEICAHTGLRLVDIWRYFRHTWASAHKSVPGRTMMILVRDAAAPHHPVVAIAALSSAAVALTARDEWLGWTPAAVISSIQAKTSPSQARWLMGVVDEAIDEIYKVDLLRDKLLTPTLLKRPTKELIGILSVVAKEEREKHFRLMQKREYKKPTPPPDAADSFWIEQAKLPLFRSKRADELSRLLSVRMVFQRYFKDKPTKVSVSQFIASGEGREAVAKVVRRAKADRVGTAVADLTVCGAIPPYNELLGGKLIAMFMASPEVVAEYRRRYGGTSSVIASSMAGRAVQREAHLVLIGTTSLYGQRPSQYDRISIPCARLGGESDQIIRYAYLGRTLGLGTFQFADSTVRAFQDFLRQSANGLQVNSVFGEGANPRLRKIRDALGLLGLPADELLEHGTPRLVYGVELASNTRDYLLGQAKRVKYLVPQHSPAKVTDAIAQWWVERWLVNRAVRDDVLQRIAEHRLVHPIRHGARVELPANDFEQPRLFRGDN